MPIPSQVFNERDPGLGLTPPAINTPIYFGTASSGTVDSVQVFGSPSAVVDYYGQGPLAEMLCKSVAVNGRAYGCRLTGSVAGAAGAVTAVPIDTGTGTITVAGAAYDAYDVIVEIMTTGTVGTGEFRYSLDGGQTYSPTYLIPSGADFTPVNTNLTLTFVPGAGAVYFEDGDTHTFTCTAPYYSTANLGTAMTAVLAGPEEFAFGVLLGTPASGSAGATMFAALDTHLQSLFAQKRFVGAVMDFGTDSTANIITALAGVTSSRICPTFGSIRMASAKAFAGWGSPLRSLAGIVGIKAAGELISTDLAHTALSGVTAASMTHDEYKLGEPLDAYKITTTRTWPGFAGAYLTNARLKSAAGSDYEYWQDRRVMDTACDTAYKAGFPVVNSVQRVQPGTGYLVENDAKSIESLVNGALQDNLIKPSAQNGTPGHASEVGYEVTRDNNVLSTREVLAKISVVPRAPVKTLTTEFGYSRTA